MSLRTALSGFANVFSRRTPATPLGKGLKAFARSIDPRAARQKFPEQQRILTELAQRLLALASIARNEDSKIIDGVCTLVATALIQQVRSEARASDEDWLWLSRWPEKMLDCLAGGYSESEALLCHLLESSWAELLSPVAVSALLDRLREMPDAAGMRSAKLMSLYEQYCIQHQAGDHAATHGNLRNVRAAGGKVHRVEKVASAGKLPGFDKLKGAGILKGARRQGVTTTTRGVGSRHEDAAIAAEGAGLVADTVDVHTSDIALPISDYVPADDKAGRDDNSVMHAYGDTNISALSNTDLSAPVSGVRDTLVFDTSVVDPTVSDTAAFDVTATDVPESSSTVIDVTVSGPAVPDTAVIDTTVIDTTVIDPTASAEPLQSDVGLPLSSTAQVAIDELEDEPPVVPIATGRSDETVQGSVSRSNSSYGPAPQSTDDAMKDDAFPTEGAAEDNLKQGVARAERQFAGKSDVVAAVQLPLPEIPVLEEVLPDATAMPSEARRLPAAEVDETADATSEARPVRDEATIDMFDALTVTPSGHDCDLPHVATLSVAKRAESEHAQADASDPVDGGEAAESMNEVEPTYDAFTTIASDEHADSTGAVELIAAPHSQQQETAAANGDDSGVGLRDLGEFPVAEEATDATDGDVPAAPGAHILEQHREAEPAQYGIFDAYEGTAFYDDDDDEAQDLGAFVQDTTTAIDDDVAAAAAFDAFGHAGRLAPIQSLESAFEDASNDAIGTGQAGEDAESSTGMLTAEQRDDAESARETLFDPFDGTAYGDGEHDGAVNLGEFAVADSAVAAGDDPESAPEDPTWIERSDAASAGNDVFDPFDGTAHSDGEDGGAVNLDEFAAADNALAADDDSESAPGDRIWKEQSAAASAGNDVFDPFDGTAFADDDADGKVNLDEFAPADSANAANDDIPAAAAFVAAEQSGLLASTQSSVSDFEDNGAAAKLSGGGDAELTAGDRKWKEQGDAASATNDVFDPFDGTAFGAGNNDEAVNLDEFAPLDSAFAADDAESSTPGDPQVATGASIRDEHHDAAPDLNDILDSFDGIPLNDGGDDDAVNLDDFLVSEEAPTTINNDVAVAAESDEAANSSGRSMPIGALAQSKLSRAAMRIVDVLLAELPEVESELVICSGLGRSSSADRKEVDEAVQRCGDVLERYASAADSVGFVGLAKLFEIARAHVRSITHAGSLSDAQVGLLAQFANVVRAYFAAPYSPESAQSLVAWAVNDGWIAPADIGEPEVLLSLLANPDLSAVDEVASNRQRRADPEDVSLAIPADVNSDLLDGLLQELPVQCEEFSAAIERLVNGTGEHEDLLVAQRIAHTIKGSGNTVGIRGLATLTHNIEDILLVLAQEKRLPSRALADMLMNSADRLQAMTEALLGMGPPPEDAVDVLQCVLDWANMIDRDGLPADDTTPESLPVRSRQPLMDSSLSAPEHASSTAAAVAPAHHVERTLSVAEQSDNLQGKVESQNKADTELEALLRVPARLVDQLLTTAGESIILTGQLRDRVRRARADLNAISFLFERQQQLGGELEKLIDVKDFSRREAQNDVSFDALEMDQYNELHSAVRQLVESATDAREMGHALVAHLASLDEMLVSQEDLNRDTQDTVLHTRMVSVKSVFPRLQRAVRQTCRATGKQVDLHLSGGETPMDSDALVRIVDPLMHLLRNAIDHGIEDAETRLRNGKAASGNVYLDFQRVGNDVVINCRDDGAGLNYDAIRHAAEERGLIGPDVSLDALKQLILRANFSTRAQASQVSGRGIGLDAVHEGVLALGGTMTVASESGRGCNFEMRLPFNLISSHAVLVRAGPKVVALASRGVKQIVHGGDGEMRRFGGKMVFQVGDDSYPATTLEAVIGDHDERGDSERQTRPVVLAHSDEGVTAVSVESVIGSRDLVVKSLGKLLPKFRGVVGATILGDGHVAPVIDLPDMLSKRSAGVDGEAALLSNTSTGDSGGFVLVVDDSLSARRALAQFLQDSGYRVRTARDGVEATELVRNVSPLLVLADLEMPRMNGIELTAHLRSTSHTEDVPVIMITSRSTSKHREQALSAGVNAYMTKPYSEDMLIEAVRRLIREQKAKRGERPAA